MQYCAKCKVSIVGNKICCPLCHGELDGAPTEEAYPYIKSRKDRSKLLIRLLTFLAITIVSICFAVNYMISPHIFWSIFVAGGVFCGWVTAIIGISYRKKLLNNIAWQLFIITAMSVIWDHFTGWHGWSIDFVLPICCMTSILCMFIIAKAKKIPANEMIFYLILDAIYGIIPIIFILTKTVKVIYPSAICVACSVISITAILLFYAKSTKDVLSRKMHL